MPGVAAVFLEQVADQSPEAGVLALCRGRVDQLVEPAVRVRATTRRSPTAGSLVVE